MYTLSKLLILYYIVEYKTLLNNCKINFRKTNRKVMKGKALYLYLQMCYFFNKNLIFISFLLLQKD